MVAPAMGCAFLLGSAASTLAFSSAPKLASHSDQMSYHFWRMTSVHLGSVIQDTRCFVKRPFLRARHSCNMLSSQIIYQVQHMFAGMPLWFKCRHAAMVQNYLNR